MPCFIQALLRFMFRFRANNQGIPIRLGEEKVGQCLQEFRNTGWEDGLRAGNHEKTKTPVPRCQRRLPTTKTKTWTKALLHNSGDRPGTEGFLSFEQVQATLGLANSVGSLWVSTPASPPGCTTGTTRRERRIANASKDATFPPSPSVGSSTPAPQPLP